MDKRLEFLNEFKSLLRKYNVSINVTYADCSDLHGIYDEAMTITHRPDPKSFKEIEWYRIDEWYINNSIIKLKEQS